MKNITAQQVAVGNTLLGNAMPYIVTGLEFQTFEAFNGREGHVDPQKRIPFTIHKYAADDCNVVHGRIVVTARPVHLTGDFINPDIPFSFLMNQTVTIE